MHYYKRNLGDYAKKAGRLSMLQHGAYTLLIDACYDREEFPTLEEAMDWTWASSKEETEAVEFVLKRFFDLEDGRYVQKRIAEEVGAFHKKAKTNSRIAIERETKRAEISTKRERIVNEASPEQHEAPPNQEPLTINQEPVNPSCPGKQKTVFTDEDKSVADLIFKKLQELNPQFKKQNLEKWADEIRLMVERDKRTRLEITDLFTWANNDSFWKTNILSPSKLREKWDRLTIQRDNPNRQQAPPNSRTTSRHNNFENLDYREGITPDGRIS